MFINEEDGLRFDLCLVPSGLGQNLGSVAYNVVVYSWYVVMLPAQMTIHWCGHAVTRIHGFLIAHVYDVKGENVLHQDSEKQHPSLFQDIILCGTDNISMYVCDSFYFEVCAT